MINVTDAYEIATKQFPQHEFFAYTETREYYMFCIGDPIFWARVNKQTGVPDMDIISADDYVFSQYLALDENNNIIGKDDSDTETIDELNATKRNSKEITELTALISSK